MIGEETLYLPIRELGAQIRAKKISIVELTEAYLDRSEKLGPRFNAYVTLTRERAMAQAKALEKEAAAGHYRGPLHGIPYAAKDLLAAKGYPTTWGAKPYENQTFDFDATVIERLDHAGAILIGKAAMIELAGGLGYSGANASLTGPCKNPWNTDYWTCGSSSGSGAVMAAGLAAFALGSDTRGSIICPSTQCGISGMRPSFGRVPKHGVMTIAWTMDKIGPMCRTADCCGLVLATIAGHDPKDQDSLAQDRSGFSYSGPNTSRPLRIGHISNAAGSNRPELEKPVDEALKVLSSHGAQVSEVAIPDGPWEDAAELVILVEAAAAYQDLIQSGRCAQLEDALGQINGYASMEFSATDYLQTQRVRVFLQDKIDKLFDQFDVLAGPGEDFPPSLLNPPQRSPEEQQRRRRPPAGEGPDLKPMDGISSLCGLPAISVPAGRTENGLPVGIGFMARALDDEKVIAAGNLFQSHTDWHTKHPAV